MDGTELVTTFATDDTMGGRISLARDALDIPVNIASRIVGVTTTTWQNWENDRSAPRGNQLDRIAGALQVSLAWLLSGRGIGPDWDHTTTFKAHSMCLH